MERLDFAPLSTHPPRDFLGAQRICPRIWRWCGAVAQLGERVVRNDEVSGSIPLSSTTPTLSFCLRVKRAYRSLRPAQPGFSLTSESEFTKTGARERTARADSAGIILGN